MSGVRIERARLLPIRLPLAAPLQTARGAVSERCGFLLELRDSDGFLGVGEALPLPDFGGEDLSACERALRGLMRALLAAPEAPSPAALPETALAAAARAPVARCAADVALHDLFARSGASSIAALLGHSSRDRLPVSALLSGGSPTELANAARRRVADGFRTLKLKLASGPLELDLERVAAVREAVGGAVALRLDANGAWSEGEALQAVKRLEAFGIELLEQPVAAAEVPALARVRRASPFPIAADEALALPGGADRVLEGAAADALILKLPVLGGLAPSLALARRARCAGVDAVVTSFLDSSLGVRAAAQLVAALPPAKRAAGLATGVLLADDLAPALRVDAGLLLLPEGPGLGAAPDPAALARLARGPALELSR